MALITDLNGNTVNCRKGIQCSRHGFLFVQKNQEVIEKFFNNIQPNDTIRELDIYDVARARIIEQNIANNPQKTSFNELTSWELQKISSFAQRFDADPVEVTKDVLTSKSAWIAIIAKNSSRQDYYEDTLVEFLSHNKNIKNVTKLAKTGPTSLTLINGKLVENTRHDKLKTLDIEFETHAGLKGYIIHKYIKESGGHQDSQYVDALESIKQQRAKNDFIVAGILDGKYFTSGRRSIEAAQKTLKNRKNIFIGNHLNFTEYLDSLQIV